MTPDERNLITGLFDRMRAQGAIQKEYEAETLINSQVRQIPDSAYMLVQSVLVGEQTLSAASERIQQLEARVRDLERTAQPSSGGSFLGGLFGGGSRPAATSVPTTRSATPANSPWGQPSGQPAQPQYQQPPMQQGYPQQAAPARAGGGFMAQAMTTAAGVAGGMLAANAISNMMGGHHGQHANSGQDQTRADASLDDAQDRQLAADAQQDDQQDQQEQDYAENNDPGVSNASDDSWGGGSSDSDA